MKTARATFIALAVLVTLFTVASFAAPKLDPELGVRLKAARPETQFGVILTFQGSRLTDSQVAAVQALGSPEVRERLASEGAEPVGNTPEQFAAFVKTELAKWAKAIKQAGAQID